MPRRSRKKKKKSQHPPPSNEHKDKLSNKRPTLEDDLREQRQRQNQRRQQEERQKQLEDSMRNGDAGNEEKDEAASQQAISFYSEQGSTRSAHRCILNGQQTLLPLRPFLSSSNVSTQRSLSSLSALRILQDSPSLSSHKRTRLAHWTASKHIFENLFIPSRGATALYYNHDENDNQNRWSNRITIPGGLYASWDMTCKHHLHPSSRTFDVLPTTLDTTAGASHTSMENDNSKMSLPTIATILQGGLGLFQPSMPHRKSRIHSLRCKPIHSVRMHEPSQRLGAIVRGSSTGGNGSQSSRNNNFSYVPGSSTPPTSTSSYQFHYYSMPHATNYIEVELGTPVYDFVFGTDLVIFSCPRFGTGNGSNGHNLSPLFLPLEGASNSTLRRLDVRNFPQSDALRVEMSCHHEKYIGFGHRNGQVSLLDLRQPSVNGCPTTKIFDSGIIAAEYGSVSDMTFLQNQRQLLVKRSFGPCELHDLRKSSFPQPSSLLHTFQVPTASDGTADGNGSGSLFACHPLLSSHRCNGLCVVDPLTEQTLLSPYINTNHQPCLGVWNLVTGDMVGNKIMHQNVAKETFYMELCSTTTLAFTENKKKRKKNKFMTKTNSGQYGWNSPSFSSLSPTTTSSSSSLSKSSSSFGVFLKCGQFSEYQIPSSKSGHIYHLTFSG